MLLAVLVVAAFEQIGMRLYPPPRTNMSLATRPELIRHLQALPVGAFLIVLTAWAAAAWSGGWLAANVGGSPAHGYATTALLVGSVIFNLVVLPHPSWFVVSTLILTPAAGLLAARTAYY